MTPLQEKIKNWLESEPSQDTDCQSRLLYRPEGSGDGVSREHSLNDFDPLFYDAARYVATVNHATIPTLQRHYEIGYLRAGNIMDQLEKAGVVGYAQGSKPRAVLLDPITVDRLLESIQTNFSRI